MKTFLDIKINGGEKEDDHESEMKRIKRDEEWSDGNEMHRRDEEWSPVYGMRRRDEEFSPYFHKRNALLAQWIKKYYPKYYQRL